jgi:hypothetical protein
LFFHNSSLNNRCVDVLSLLILFNEYGDRFSKAGEHCDRCEMWRTNLMSSRKLRQQSCGAFQASALRARLLGGTALTVCAFGLTGGASANDLTFNNVNVLTNLIGGLWYVPVGGTTVANVNTADLNTTLGFNAVWIAQVGLGGTQNISVAAGRSVTGFQAIRSTAFTDTINITNNGALIAADHGIYAQNLTSGDINVSGAGTTTSTGNGMWLLTPSGTVNVGATGAPIGAVNGGLNGIVVTNPGAININASRSSGTAGYGIWTAGGTGNQSISTTGAVSGLTGQYLNSTTGNIVADGNGTSTTTGTAGQGITIGTVAGNMTVQNYASVTGTASGAWLVGFTGSANVTNNGAITGTAVNGTLITTTTGAINVNNNGPITGGIYGVQSASSTGNISTSNNGAITGGTSGVYVATAGAGTVATNNNASITGTSAYGVYGTTTAGAISTNNNGRITGGTTGISVATLGGAANVNGNGPITGTTGWGVYVGTVDGNINIGNSAFNGVILGGTNGIDARSIGVGNVNVSTNADVTGTSSWGIYAASTNGNTAVNLTAGTVTGGTVGLDARAFGSGNVNTTIAAPVIVQGAANGYTTGTIGGTSTTNNAGLIRSIGDTGAAGTAGGSAIIVVAGTSVINNTGQVIGRQSSAGLAYTFNNQAAGVWTPGTGINNFAGLNDTVNNSGLINVRTGTTTFNTLESLNNLAGGRINLAYGGAAATDNLVVLGFRPLAGSSATFNFDAVAANNSAMGFDNSADGKGTADTIVVVGAATPGAKSTINLVTSGTPTSLTGSVALVYTGVNMIAPTAGANLTQSVNYQFGTGNPSNGRTVYYLIDDGAGGVYLQWKPNLSGAALGGFGGPFGGAGGGASGASAGSAIGAASGGSSGVGGVGLGGGPTGGGALGRIADMAAGSVAGSTYCQQRRYIQAWGQLEGERSRFSGGGGHSSSVTGGLEVDAGEQLGLGCNRLGFGVFGMSGNSSASWATGSNDGDNAGVGAYVRATSATGLYASLMGALNWSDAKLKNAVYVSSADKSSKSHSGAGAIGYIARLAPTTSVDLRGFASFSRSKADPFTDTAGIAVSESKDEVLTYGASIGLQQILSSNVQGFLRVGIKKSELDSSITVFGNNFTGSATGVARSVEGGFNGMLGDGVQLGVSGFGTRSDGTTGYGGRAHVGIKF